MLHNKELSYKSEMKEVTMGWTCSLDDTRRTYRILVTKFTTWKTENNTLGSLSKQVLKM
jgi:hypothetical protein